MKLRVTTHSSQEFEVIVETYEPDVLNSQCNNNEIYTVLIGDMIFSRVDIKRIEPMKEAN